MGTIDRVGLIVSRKQPYLDWALAILNDSLLLNYLKQHSTIYLVYDIDNHDTLEDLVEMYHLEIFEEELDSWCTDETKWPEDRTVSKFLEWFTVSLSHRVLDAEDEAIAYYDEDDE
jgi:hypothetical protein